MEYIKSQKEGGGETALLISLANIHANTCTVQQHMITTNTVVIQLCTMLCMHITRHYDTHSLTPATHVLSQLTKPLFDRWDIANGS